MGGKKKLPEKKKAGDHDGDIPAEMNGLLEVAMDGLKQQLVFESEPKDQSLIVVNQIQHNQK